MVWAIEANILEMNKMLSLYSVVVDTAIKQDNEVRIYCPILSLHEKALNKIRFYRALEVITMPLTFEKRLAFNVPLKEEENERAPVAASAASLDHHQKTGLYITLDELKEWARTVRKDRQVKIPACHR